MNRKMVFLSVILVLIVGCQQLGIKKPETPVERYAAISHTYAALLNTSGDLYETGVISKTDLEKFRKASVPVSTLLDEWRFHLENGWDTNSVEQKTKDALDELETTLNERADNSNVTGSNQGDGSAN